MNEQILIIDDDEQMTDLLQPYLERFGFKVRCAPDARAGLRLIRQSPPDLVVLDVMLPEMDGFEACRRIRDLSAVPIVMLTARGEVTDRIVGLELGADDYLAKPFEPRELAARIQAILRRVRGDLGGEVLRFGALVIDSRTRTARIGDQDLGLTAMEFGILALFASQPGRVFDRDQIMERTRGMEWEAFNRSVDVLISRLRQKLGDDPRKPRYLKTVWGTGYMFVADEGEGGHP